MNCKNCGAEIGDYCAFCTYCGAPVGNHGVDLNKPGQTDSATPPPGYSEPIPQDGREPFQQPEFGQVPDFNRSNTNWQNNYSGYIPNAAQSAAARPNGATWREIKLANCIISENGQRYGIGWLKFIVYVQLFAGALLHLINTFLYCSGALYGTDSEIIYLIFPELHGLDIAMGVLSLLLCGATVLTRFMLTGLRRLGPWMYLGVYACNVLMSILYTVIACAVTGLSLGELISARDISQIITSIALIAANFVYFRNRTNAFVN